MAKAASRFRSFLEKHSVSLLSRFMNTRWVPFNLTTCDVAIVPFLRIEPFSQATLTRGEPPQELQSLGIPVTSKPRRVRKKPKRKKSQKR